MINDSVGQSLIEVLDGMARLEMAVSQLYLAYSQQFAADAQLWRELAEEELYHAELADQMKTFVKDNPGKCFPGKFNSSAIATFLEGIENHLADVKAGNVDRKKALILARDTENAMLEKNYFDTVTSDLPAIKNNKKKMMQDTYLHRKRITDYIQSLQGEI